jgi:hypothetical protein
MDTLANIRRELARTTADLRDVRHEQHVARLRAELGLYNSVGDAKQIGSNEADRKRAYDSVCEADPEYVAARDKVRLLEARISLLEADLNIWLDERHERDLALRERNLDAFMSKQP